MPVRSKQPRDDDPAALASRPREAQQWLDRATRGFRDEVNATEQRQPLDAPAKRPARDSVERERHRPLEAHFADPVVAAEFDRKYRAAYWGLADHNDGDAPKHEDVAKELGLSDYRLRKRRTVLDLSWPPPRPAKG